jgi:large subunit ribosomal protein L33
MYIFECVLRACALRLDFYPSAASLPATVKHEVTAMAKATTIKVKLVSSADTGFYYVTKKNSRTMTDKLTKKKYDPVAKKHVEFREAKIK